MCDVIGGGSAIGYVLLPTGDCRAIVFPDPGYNPFDIMQSEPGIRLSLEPCCYFEGGPQQISCHSEGLVLIPCVHS